MQNEYDPDSKIINKHRVITQLDRDELEFLDKLGKDALFASGHKLSYNDILKCLVDLAIEMGLSWESIDNIKSVLVEKMILKSKQKDKKQEGNLE